MAEVERLLVASAVQVTECDPRHPDARACLRAYFSELSRRFDGGFDPARSISADDEELTPPAGLLLVATLHGEPVGCGALKFHGDGPIEIKRMWVSPAVRGLGLGRRLLAELEARAAARGVGTLRLETNRALDEAIGLYRDSGYREVRRVQRRALRPPLVREDARPLFRRLTRETFSDRAATTSCSPALSGHTRLITVTIRPMIVASSPRIRRIRGIVRASARHARRTAEKS